MRAAEQSSAALFPAMPAEEKFAESLRKARRGEAAGSSSGFYGPHPWKPHRSKSPGPEQLLGAVTQRTKAWRGRDTRWSQPPALTVVRGKVPGAVPLTLRAGVPRDAAFMPGFVLMSEASPGGDRAGASPLLSSPLPAAPCARRSSNQGRDFRDS